METPEQYTVKTPEEIIKKLSLYIGNAQVVYTDKAIDAFEEYTSETLASYNRQCERNDELQEELDNLKEAMKTNSETMRIWRGHAMEELLAAREENLKYRMALTEAKVTLEWHLDNSQPKHDRDQSDFFNMTANAITWSDNVLSKFQPKKDERTNS